MTLPSSPSPFQVDVDDAWEFIEKAHTGVLTTYRRDGVAISLPVWFMVVDRQIFVRTPAHSKKVTRVRNDPRASFVVSSGEYWAELVGVHLTGYAEVVDDPRTEELVLARSNAKYDPFRLDPSDMAEPMRTFYLLPKATLRFVPEEMLGWNNAQLLGRG
jgi:PPOX class probable F420-dependent enzyme